MKNSIRGNTLNERIDAEVARYKKEYAENEAYRIEAEKQYIRNPKLMKYSKGFYMVGECSSLIKKPLLFPVKIVDGRKLFGKLQCLITPIGSGNRGLFDAPLGKKWVDRKFLILQHDHDYKKYEMHLDANED